MIERLVEDIRIRAGGKATAKEVSENRGKINEIIDWINDHERESK